MRIRCERAGGAKRELKPGAASTASTAGRRAAARAARRIPPPAHRPAAAAARMWLRLCLALALTLGGLPPAAHAASLFWNAATGQWDAAGNWTPDGPPAAGDYVYINNGGTAQAGAGVTGAAYYLSVGYSGTGELSVTDGGTVTSAGDIYLGLNANSSGTVRVSGTNSRLENTAGYLSVGHSGTGELSVTAGGTVTSARDISLGYNTTGSGTVRVSGTNSRLENTAGYLFVGNSGTGDLSVTDGGTVTSAGGIYLGSEATGSGTVRVSGTNSRLENTAGYLFVGTSDTGHLFVTAGGTVTSAGTISLGFKATASGTVRVSGTNSRLENTSDSLYVGTSGTGHLSVTDGGTVTSAVTIYLGSAATGSGTVLVSGTNSRLETTAGILYVGTSGTGHLSVTDGGTVTSARDIYLGYNTTSSGTVRVSGTNSRLETTAGSLYVGNSGTGDLSVTAGGTVTSAGTIYLGREVNSSGTVTVSGTGSTLKTTGGNLSVGRRSTGTNELRITNGGTAAVTGAVNIGGGEISTDTGSGMALVGTGSTLSATGAIYVGQNGPGLLAGTGSLSAGTSVSFYSKGVLSAGDQAGQVGTLAVNASNVYLQNATTLRVDVAADGAADHIAVTGNAFAAAGSSAKITIDLGSLHNTANAAVLTASGTLTTNTTGLSNTEFTLNGTALTALASRVTGNVPSLTVSGDGKSLLLTTDFSAQSEQLHWNGNADSSWNMTSANWTGAQTTFLAGDWVTFGVSGDATITLPAGTCATASQMDVTDGTWVFDGDIVVNKDAWVGTPLSTAPDGRLHISGASTSVTLKGANVFSDGIAIASGSLTLQSGGAAGNAAIANAGTLALNYSGAFANTVSGAGALVKQGAGEITLTGANTYTGATTVSGGTLRVGDGRTSGSLGAGASGGASVASGAALIFDRSDAVAFAGVISGAGSLRKEGAGTLTLTGENSLTGTVSVMAGTLNVGGGGASGSLSGNAVVAGGATLIFDRSGASVYGGDIGGTGSVIKQGSGTLTLTGAITPDFTLSGGVLAGTGSLAKTTLAGGTSVSPGVAGVNGGLGTLAMGDGGTTAFNGVTYVLDLGADNASDRITVAGTADLAGSAIDLTSWLPGVYTVLTATAIDNPITAAGITVNGAALGSRQEVTLAGSGATALVLGLSTDPLALTWDGVSGATWNGLTAANTVWERNDTHALSYFIDGDTVLFDASGTNKTIAVSGAVKPAGMTVSADEYVFSGDAITSDGRLSLNASGTSTTTFKNAVAFGGGIDVAAGNTLTFDYTATTHPSGVAVAGAISGEGALDKRGDGVLTLTGAAAHGGGTTVSAGTLKLSGSGSLAATGSLATTGGTFDISGKSGGQTVASLSGTGGGVELGGNTLTVNRASGSDTYAGVISGPGSLVKQGAGTLILTGANTHAATTVSAGTLQVGSGTAGSLTGNIVNNAAVVFSRSNDYTYAGNISGTGAVTRDGAGTLTLTGAATHSGGTTVSAGTLQIGAGGSVAGAIVTNAALVFNRSDAMTHAGAITGTGMLEQKGSGTLTLSGGVGAAGARLGAVRVSGGTLLIAAGSSVYADTVSIGAGKTLGLTAGSGPAVTAGSFQAAASSIVDITGYSGSSPAARVVLVQADAAIGRDYTLTVGGVAVPAVPDITTFLALQEDRSEARQIALTNVGLVWNNESEKAVSTNTGTAHGTFTVATSFKVESELDDNRSAQGGKGFAGWDGTTLTKDGAGALILTKANTYSGGTTILAGTLTLAENASLGNGAYAGAIVNSGTLSLAQAGDQILSGALSGAGGISKSGSGLLTLSGSSAGYAGVLTQTAGTVHLAGAFGSTGGGGYVQNGGAFTSTNGAALGAATFRGTVTPSGVLNAVSAGFDGATVDLGLLTAGNAIAVTNAASFTDTTVLVDAAGAGVGIFTLIDYGSAAQTGATVTAANLAPGARGGSWFDTGDTAFKYEIFTGSTSLTWDGTAAAAAWNDDVAGNANWSNGKFNTWFKNGDDVTFADNAAYRTVAVDAAGVTVGAMDVQGDYSFTGGAITAAGAVTVADGKALGLVAGAAPALDAATLDFNTSGGLDITGYIPDESSPYAGATKNTLTLVTSGGVSGFSPLNVTVAGQTGVDFLTARAWQDGNDIKVDTSLSWYLGDSRAHGDFTVADGRTFTLGAVLADEAANAALNWDGATLTKKGGGTLVLTGANTYGGGTLLREGRIDAGHGSALGSGGLTMAEGTVLGFAADNLDLGNAIVLDGNGFVDTGAYGAELSGGISGAGGLTKRGAGTLTLSGANSYTGPTTVQGGVLALGSDLAGSSGLTLHRGAAFATNGHAHSLAGRTLTVHGAATYDGDLDAGGADMNFITDGPVTGTMLAVTGTAHVEGGRVGVGVSGGHRFSAGDSLSLLKAVRGLTGTVAPGDGGGILREGATVVHNLGITTTADEILATVLGGGGATEQAKALSEGRLGGMILTLQGADLAAGRGMDAALRAAWAAGDGSGPAGGRAGTASGAAGFGAVSGGMLRHNTGSHVDMHSVSVLAGLARGVRTPAGALTLGAFFEYGNGSYSTHNSFSNAAAVDGDGSTSYIGGGILGRMDFVETGPGRAYAEASARAGRTHNEYDSDDLRDADGRTADYETSALYYGLHVGAGYIWDISGAASLDVHGKYFWTRQESGSDTLSTGESVRFKSTDSHRSRLGARFSYRLNEYVAPYAGAAWEYEFDGKARAATNGNAIDAPDLRGSTGIGELGLAVRPGALPVSFDLGVQGYAGKREGVTGSLQFRVEF